MDIDQRIEALTVNVDLISKDVEKLRETVAPHDRELQEFRRFRKALQLGFRAWLYDNPDQQGGPDA